MSSSFNQRQQQDYFPEENYEAMRRPIREDSSVNLTYKPISEPAWDKHKPQVAPRAARFEKLTRWGHRSTAVQSAVAWVAIAAGAATLAGPAILQHLPH